MPGTDSISSFSLPSFLNLLSALAPFLPFTTAESTFSITEFAAFSVAHLPWCLSCKSPYADSCMCRTDLAGSVSSMLADCVSSACPDSPPDMTSAQELYGSYCASSLPTLSAQQAFAASVAVPKTIRDVYQNLRSDEYSAKKGFCEDFDEGKYSLPLIHAVRLNSSNSNMQMLRELLQRRREVEHMSEQHKHLVLEQLESAGSMAYTRETLKRLQAQVDTGVKIVESRTGRENWVLRALLQRLEV
ncbi:hypothetical protein BU16DRAFT_561398 [Lophium mytilinum]|uniref:geranylgeranyl diphosphate synthase n=1 Tax=Lophium mytilinum TaxID=390894 RepID=A0A6A6QRR0_9PEZI|nr:hypothetical protein BU16DRAFT_561398 [Lophium mytilinum]